jgi:hypothetical protein
MSFIKKLFSGPDTLNKAMDAVVKGGDALILTEEEKIQYKQEAMKLHLAITEKVANESTPTALSRRYVAFTVLMPFAFLHIGAAFLYLFGWDLKGDDWLEIAKNFEWPTFAVIGFYFGTHVVKGLKGK